MKIAQFNRPSYDLLKTVIDPSANQKDKEYSEEKAALNVVENATNGLLVNANNEPILDDKFEKIQVQNSDFSNEDDKCSENKISNTLSSGFPILNYYTFYSYPSSIVVKMDLTGSGAIKTVNFNTYIKNVLPNEWFPSWNSEALKAGAYCVKMVGWYRTINPVSPSMGVNVYQTTQKYVPSTELTSTNNAFNSISGLGMSNSEYKLFFPEYAAGTSGSAGSRAGGQLKQWGSQYLASMGYGHNYILNYYYSGSEYSSGDLTYFSY